MLRRTLSRVPKRRGETYCSSACGRGCTYAEYERAQKGSKRLVAKLAKGDLKWEPCVWDNLGWHYSATSTCQRFEVHETLAGGYHAFLNAPGELPAGIWVGQADDPLEAVADARKQALAHLTKYAVCVDMKLVPNVSSRPEELS